MTVSPSHFSFPEAHEASEPNPRPLCIMPDSRFTPSRSQMIPSSHRHTIVSQGLPPRAEALPDGQKRKDDTQPAVLRDLPSIRGEGTENTRMKGRKAPK